MLFKDLVLANHGKKLRLQMKAQTQGVRSINADRFTSFKSSKKAKVSKLPKVET